VDEPPAAPPSSLASDKDAATTTEQPTTPHPRIQPSWTAIKQFMIRVTTQNTRLLVFILFLFTNRICLKKISSNKN